MQIYTKFQLLQLLQLLQLRKRKAVNKVVWVQHKVHLFLKSLFQVQQNTMCACAASRMENELVIFGIPIVSMAQV